MTADALKRLEIYYFFPDVALYEATKNRYKIKAEKMNYVEQILRSKIQRYRQDQILR